MSERMHTWHFLCDTCKYADGDGGGHFMCTDYAPPWWGGESSCTSEKHAISDEQEPREVCLGYMNAHAERLRGEGEGE